MEYRLRLASPEDVEEIHRVMHAAASALPDPLFYFVDSVDFIHAHVSREGFIVVALEGAGNVAGFQVVRIPGRSPDNLGHEIGLPDEELLRVAHMESAAVLPVHWGKGLQRAMLKEAERRLASQGFQKLMCTVHPENRHSLANLERLGYKPVVTMSKYGGYLRHVMLKELP